VASTFEYRKQNALSFALYEERWAEIPDLLRKRPELAFKADSRTGMSPVGSALGYGATDAAMAIESVLVAAGIVGEESYDAANMAIQYGQWPLLSRALSVEGVVVSPAGKDGLLISLARTLSGESPLLQPGLRTKAQQKADRKAEGISSASTSAYVGPADFLEKNPPPADMLARLASLAAAQGSLNRLDETGSSALDYAMRSPGGLRDALLSQPGIDVAIGGGIESDARPPVVVAMLGWLSSPGSAEAKAFARRLYLLNKGWRIGGKHDTLLHFAARFQPSYFHPDSSLDATTPALNTLLSWGERLSARNDDGELPLHAAARNFMMAEQVGATTTTSTGTSGDYQVSTTSTPYQVYCYPGLTLFYAGKDYRLLKARNDQGDSSLDLLRRSVDDMHKKMSQFGFGYSPLISSLGEDDSIYGQATASIAMMEMLSSF
jgi:hypothetical protein